MAAMAAGSLALAGIVLADAGPGQAGALAAALARNVFPDDPEAAGAPPLAAYVREQRSHLGAQDAGTIAGGQISFKEPMP